MINSCMAINYNLVSEKIFNLLRGKGFEVSSYNKEGDIVVNPQEATRFLTQRPNLLVRLDRTKEEISLSVGKQLDDDGIRLSLKELAQDNLMSFDFRIFDKKLQPKGEKIDVAKKSEKGMMEEINIIRKLSGLDPVEEKVEKDKKYDIRIDGDKGTTKDGHIYRAVGDDQDYSQYLKVFYGDGKYFRIYYDDRVGRYAPDQVSPETNDPKAKKVFANLPDDFFKKYGSEGENGIEDIIDMIKSVEENTKDQVAEASLGKMTGSRKSSYQPLTDNVKIIVRHNKDVNEEVRGARSRNIHSILIQRGEEKFKMAENNLSAARAMARHLHNGGETFDPIGESITSMAKDFGKLKEFVRYVRSSNLVNETNQEFVDLAFENIEHIKTNLKRLSGVKSYATACETVQDYNNVELLQDDLDLESKFTETHFDDKVANVMDNIKAMASRKTAFETKITNAIAIESFKGVKGILAEDDGMDFATPEAKLGHQVSQLGYTAKDKTLGNYLHGISNKLSNGGQLTQFEYGAIKSSLLSASQYNESIQFEESAEDSYESFINQFVEE